MTSADNVSTPPPGRITTPPEEDNGPSISAALKGHRNSLGLLRMILASLVIVDHAFPLGGYGIDPFWNVTNGQASLGSIAVLGFFAISGYLIAKSGMSADVVQFVWRRALRIFPAFWLVLLVAAFLVGPVIWMLEGRPFFDYFTLAHNGPVAYIVKNAGLQIGTYGIYDLFATTTPYGHEVGASVFNGSLWTLIYEWQCYMIVAVLVLFGVMIRARIIVPLMAGLLGIVAIAAQLGSDEVQDFIPLLADPQLLGLTFTFLVGSTIAIYSKKVPFDDRLGILAGIVLVLSFRLGGFGTVGVVAGSYFVLYLAARLPKQVQWIGAKNDYSYGIYVYGFLVQQVLAYFGVYRLGYVPFVLIALIITAGCAWVSWHLVEKRALALKDWGPGRGWRYWYDRARDRIRAIRSRNQTKEDAEQA